MRYFKLTIAYDGTDFHGWQIQAGKPTIQGEIVEVLRRLTQEHVVLHGAGRTDAGVHALGQVGSFRTQSRLSAQDFQRALNALLPPTIRIVGADEVGPDFNARWSARGKTYRYRLYRGRVVPPMIWRYVLHYPFPLDEDAMRDAAARFAGTHDFASFAASTAPKRTTKRGPRSEKSCDRVSAYGGQRRVVFIVRGRSFFVIWCARWWGLCWMLGVEDSRLRTSIACTNSGIARSPVLPCLPRPRHVEVQHEERGTSER